MNLGGRIQKFPCRPGIQTIRPSHMMLKFKHYWTAPWVLPLVPRCGCRPKSIWNGRDDAAKKNWPSKSKPCLIGWWNSARRILFYVDTRTRCGKLWDMHMDSKLFGSLIDAWYNSTAYNRVERCGKLLPYALEANLEFWEPTVTVFNKTIHAFCRKKTLEGVDSGPKPCYIKWKPIVKRTSRAA